MVPWEQERPVIRLDCTEEQVVHKIRQEGERNGARNHVYTTGVIPRTMCPAHS